MLSSGEFVSNIFCLRQNISCIHWTKHIITLSPSDTASFSSQSTSELTERAKAMGVLPVRQDQFGIAYSHGEQSILCVFSLEYGCKNKRAEDSSINVKNELSGSLPPVLDTGRLYADGVMTGKLEECELLGLALNFRFQDILRASARWKVCKSYSLTFFLALSSLCVYVCPSSSSSFSSSSLEERTTSQDTVAASSSSSSFPFSSCRFTSSTPTLGNISPEEFCGEGSLSQSPPSFWGVSERSSDLTRELVPVMENEEQCQRETLLADLMYRAQREGDMLISNSLFLEEPKHHKRIPTDSPTAISSSSPEGRPTPKRAKTENEPIESASVKPGEQGCNSYCEPSFFSSLICEEDDRVTAQRVQNTFLVSLPPQIFSKTLNEWRNKSDCDDGVVKSERVCYGPQLQLPSIISQSETASGSSQDQPSGGCCMPNEAEMTHSGGVTPVNTPFPSCTSPHTHTTTQTPVLVQTPLPSPSGTTSELPSHTLRFLEQQCLSSIGYHVARSSMGSTDGSRKVAWGDSLMDVLPLLDLGFAASEPIEGPLLFNQHSPGKNIFDLQIIHHAPPPVLLRFEQGLREVPFCALEQWQYCCLSPFSKDKDVEFVVIPPPPSFVPSSSPSCPSSSSLMSSPNSVDPSSSSSGALLRAGLRAREKDCMVNFFRSLQCTYEACQLGMHRPLFASSTYAPTTATATTSSTTTSATSFSSNDYLLNVPYLSSSSSSSPCSIEDYYSSVSKIIINKINKLLTSSSASHRRTSGDTLILYFVCSQPVILSSFCNHFSKLFFTKESVSTNNQKTKSSNVPSSAKLGECPEIVREYFTRSTVVIQFVPLSACYNPLSPVLRELALSVYNKVCRPRKLVEKYHSLDLNSELCFEPAVILRHCTPISSPIEKLLSSQKLSLATSSDSNIAGSSQGNCGASSNSSSSKPTKPVVTVHLAYSWSSDKTYLCGACMDGRGENVITTTVRHQFSGDAWCDVNSLFISFRLFWFKTATDVLNIVPKTHAVRLVIAKLGELNQNETEAWEKVFVRDGFGVIHSLHTRFAEEKDKKKSTHVKQQITDVFVVSADLTTRNNPLQIIEEASEFPQTDTVIVNSHIPLTESTHASEFPMASANIFFRQHTPTPSSSPSSFSPFSSSFSIPFPLLRSYVFPLPLSTTVSPSLSSSPTSSSSNAQPSASSKLRPPSCSVSSPSSVSSASSLSRLRRSLVSISSLDLSLVSYLFNFAVLEERPTEVLLSAQDFKTALANIAQQFIDSSHTAPVPSHSNSFAPAVDHTPLSLPFLNDDDVHDEEHEIDPESRLPLHLAVVARLAFLVRELLVTT